MTCIQHPIYSAAQPAASDGGAARPALIIQGFMIAWDEEKATADYKKRVELSERNTEERRELKKAAHAARLKLLEGKKLNNAILYCKNVARFDHE